MFALSNGIINPKQNSDATNVQYINPWVQTLNHGVQQQTDMYKLSLHSWPIHRPKKIAHRKNLSQISRDNLHANSYKTAKRMEGFGHNINTRISLPLLVCHISRDLRIVFLRSNRISNRIGRPIRFRIEFSNRIGRIYHASRNTV